MLTKYNPKSINTRNDSGYDEKKDSDRLQQLKNAATSVKESLQKELAAAVKALFDYAKESEFEIPPQEDEPTMIEDKYFGKPNGKELLEADRRLWKNNDILRNHKIDKVNTEKMFLSETASSLERRLEEAIAQENRLSEELKALSASTKLDEEYDFVSLMEIGNG